MDWAAIFWQIVRGAGKTAIYMTCVLLVIMVFLQVIKDSGLLDRMSRRIQPIMRWFSLPKEGAFPLLAGVLCGISFGSGVIIPFAREGHLNKREMTLIGAFLAIAHGMIEDPLLFVTIGASWWMVFFSRFVLAFALILVVARLLPKRLGAIVQAEPVGEPRSSEEGPPGGSGPSTQVRIDLAESP